MTGWRRWRAELPQLQGKTLVTLPGRITRWKGHEDFIGIVGVLKQSGVNVHGLLVGGAEPRRRGFLKEFTAADCPTRPGTRHHVPGARAPTCAR